MRFAYLLEAKHAGRLGLEPASRQWWRNCLQRNVGQREARRAEHKTTEEREVDTTRHLQQRVEVLDRREPPQPTCEARTAASAQHGKGIEDGAVADKIEHRVELFGLGDALGEIRALQLDARGAQLLHHSESLLAARGGNDSRAGID